MRKFLLWVGFVLLWAACNMGCRSSGRVQRALDVLDEHKKEAAKYCADNFPPDVRTEYKEGKKDTVTQVKTETKFIEVECPPGEVKTTVKKEIQIQYKDKVIHQRDTVTERIRDLARETYLEAEISDLRVTLAQYIGESEKWKARAKKRAGNQIILIGLLTLAVGFIFRKPLFALVRGLMGIPTIKI